MTINSEWRIAGLSVLAAVFFFLVSVVAYTSADGMGGGYALAFIAFFLTLAGIAVCLLFVHRARVMDTILSDPYPLARWTYPEEVALQAAECEYQDFQERNRAMFIVIGGMLAAVALFFMVFLEDGGFETGIFLLAAAALLFVVSRVTPWLERRRAGSAPREAFISRSGIIYQGRVYPFRSFLTVHGEVTFHAATKKSPALVVFPFAQLVRTIVQTYDVAIPVPPGEEEHALAVVRELNR